MQLVQLIPRVGGISRRKNNQYPPLQNISVGTTASACSTATPNSDHVGTHIRDIESPSRSISISSTARRRDAEIDIAIFPIRSVSPLKRGPNPTGKTKTSYSGISLFWGQVRVRGVFVPGILNRVIRLKPLFRCCLFQGIYGEE